MKTEINSFNENIQELIQQFKTQVDKSMREYN